MRWSGGIFIVYMASAYRFGDQVVGGLSVGIPISTSAELLQAVDVYLSSDSDDQAMLEVIGKFGLMESWDVSRISDFSHLFSRVRNPNVVQLNTDLSKWDVSNSESFASMFQGARTFDFDVSTWKVSNAKNFSRMFDLATNFQGRGLTSWDVSAGQDFTEMFRGATSFGTNPDTNDLCVWRDLISSSAVIDDMFAESFCPANSFPVSPTIKAGIETDSSTIANFCQYCQDQDQSTNQGQQSETAEPTAAPTEEDENNKKQPNILFIMTDQQRFDAIRHVQDELSHYDGAYKIETPNLDRLVTEGAYFRNAYCQCAVCAPARATIRTGCTIERTGIQHNDLAEDYDDGDLFKDRVESLVSLDHILVEKYGYTSEYYGKWHLPDKLYHSKSDPSENVIRFNDFDFTVDEFEFRDDENSQKVRRYFKQYEELGKITQEQKEVDSTALTTGILPRLTGGNPQIDSYTRYPYIPIQLDSRYGLPIGTDLKDGDFDSFESSQPSLMGIFSLTEEEGTPTQFTGEIAIRALHQLKANSEPWFLTVSFNHPHPPFVVPYSDHFEKYWANRDLLHVPVSLNDPMDNSAYDVITEEFPGYKDPAKLQEWTAIYYAMIEEVDTKIGEILNALGSAVKDTLIIFTSDHGEMLGAHGRRSKNTFYEESTKIPLIMKFPGRIESGIEIDEMVSHLDLFATILDYAGASSDDNSDGKSLRPFIEGTEYNKDYDEGNVVFAEWDYRMPDSPGSDDMDRDIDDRPSFLVRKGNYKLMMQKLSSSKQMDMMFDLENDPFEMDNLLGRNAEDADTSIIHKAEHLRCLLLDWMKRLDGDEGYFSDPAANYGDNDGDINEIRRRQKWKQVGFWISDEVLEFGRLTKRNDGTYVRHEHLYLGTRQDETITITSIEVSGPDADSFTVDQDTLEFEHRDCRSIRITLESLHQLPKGSTMNGMVTLQVDRDVYTIQLSLSKDVYGDPLEEENEEQVQEEDDDEQQQEEQYEEQEEEDEQQQQEEDGEELQQQEVEQPKEEEEDGDDDDEQQQQEEEHEQPHDGDEHDQPLHDIGDGDKEEGFPNMNPLSQGQTSNVSEGASTSTIMRYLPVGRSMLFLVFLNAGMTAALTL
jgi:arylsulfatase A-like enzyme